MRIGMRELVCDKQTMESELECLRPLVETTAWDYCVVWKSTQASRFLEWEGCCCSGGYVYNHNAAEDDNSEGGGEEGRRPWAYRTFCRDTHFQHPVRAKACETLACLPFYVPLSSGIHGEVVLSSQPLWLSHVNVSELDPSQMGFFGLWDMNVKESIGTMVLIPVSVGLIELFSAKHVPKDQNIIDYVMAQFNVSMEQKGPTMYSLAKDYQLRKQKPLSLRCVNPTPSSDFVPPGMQARNFGGFESSSCSNPSQAVVSGFKCSSVECYSRTQSPKCQKIVPGSSMSVMTLESVDSKQDAMEIKTPKTAFKSKNIIAERNRRNKIRQRLHILRSLVPNISKVSKAATLGDAIQYIQCLQEKVKKLQTELRDEDVVDIRKENTQEEIGKSNEMIGGNLHLPATGTQNYHGSSNISKNIKPMKARVEVHQIGMERCLLKVQSEQKRGGFARLMEVMSLHGFEVVDASVTTSEGKVSSIFLVEAKPSMNGGMPPRLLGESVANLVDYIKQETS